MQSIEVNGYRMSYLEVGTGPTLVCVHGSLCDFRAWFPVLGPLSLHHTIVAISLRHCFPENWDGKGETYSIAQHVADLIAFIEKLDAPRVHLLGHSRGGHVAFRVAQRQPHLVHRLILAEPGGELESSLGSTDADLTSLKQIIPAAAQKLASGDLDGGLSDFVDALEGSGTWKTLPSSSRQMARDNARTLLAQVREERQPFSLADARSITAPTLFIGGAKSSGSMPKVMQALANNLPICRSILIPNSSHMMFAQCPLAFCEAVVNFLRE